MKRVTGSCCSPKRRSAPDYEEMEIPEQIQKDLEACGGFDALTRSIPARSELEEEARIHHALADPLRLTILYLIRDQPLCVCVINRFMRLANSKLSYHLTILKESGLIEGESHGNWIIYSITECGRRLMHCRVGGYDRS
ncbi:metalloregulator ArsR/SmtB family transcription factor [Methanoregula sp.]|uniref:ArsR/SmtB family transcription factor n=1 Tax=Methanoregula sp. TaxID=2052170 RepID=UPI00261282FD|nr:metalloregulator ArsR/SmtB family transcription factor [Methanoregula sp.]MDD5143867.1 metalloregulator ArsR/SmtB family transcription factor [Methanoregula sp.]